MSAIAQAELAALNMEKQEVDISRGTVDDAILSPSFPLRDEADRRLMQKHSLALLSLAEIINQRIALLQAVINKREAGDGE